MRNPWKDVRVPEWRPTRRVFLTPERWLHLLDTVRGEPVAVLLAFSYRAGLRHSEIRYLRVRDDLVCDGPEPVVRIQSRSGRHAWRPKTKRGERDVPIFPDLVEVVREHIARGYAGERYLLRSPGLDRPLDKNVVLRWTEDAYRRAGIRYGRDDGEAFTLHAGRHSYASWMAQAGVPLNLVAELLGDTLQVVVSTYAHLVPDTLRTAASAAYRMVREAEGAANTLPTEDG